MKLHSILWLFFIFFATLIFAFPNRLNAAYAVEPQGTTHQENTIQQTNGGMPAWPQPVAPIPHHRPGYRANMKYSNSAGQVAGSSLQASNSLDALLEDGTMSDPFQGNYTFVEHEQIMLGWSEPITGGITNNIHSEASRASVDSNGDALYELAAPSTIENSKTYIGGASPNSSFSLIARDINQDGQDEQITAWINPARANQISISIGQMAGTIGKVKGNPVAIMTNNGTELFVRGFDDTLWQRIDQEAGQWKSLGGVLADSPAAVSLPGSDTIQIFALGTDGAIYNRVRHGAEWSREWQKVHPTADLVFQSAPSAIVNGNSTMVFARALDNTVWYCTFDGTTCTEWQAITGGFVTSTPQAVGANGIPIALFARGFDNGLWHSLYNNGQWSPWRAIDLPDGISLSAAPAVIPSTAGAIELYLLASDKTIRRAQFTLGSAATWTTVADFSNTPASESSIPTHLYAAAPNLIYARLATGQVNKWQPVNSTWPGELMPNLPACCTQIETSLTPLSSDARIVVDTGYFTNTNNPQVVVATINLTRAVEVHLYDIASNGQSSLVGKATLTDTLNANSTFHLATGNFAHPTDNSRSGQDEIAIAISRPTDFAVQIWSLDEKRQLVKAAESAFGNRDYLDNFYPKPTRTHCSWPAKETKTYNFVSATNHTINLSRGLFTQDGLDSLAISFSSELYFEKDFWCGEYGETHYAAFTIALHANNPTDIVTSQQPLWVNVPNNSYPFFAMVVGDITGPTAAGERIDEVVAAYPNGTIHLYSVDANMAISRLAETSGSFGNTQVTVSAGDLNRDLQDEIVVFANGTLPTAHLYQYADTQLTLKYTHEFSGFPDTATQHKLTLGSFTGETLRVGPPTHRVEQEVLDIVAIINIPPTHKDTAAGFDNSQDDDTFSAFETEEQTESVVKVEHHRNWKISQRSAAGLFGLFEKSVTATYGQNFVHATTDSTTTIFGEKMISSRDDRLIYTVTDYDVWEYPIIADDNLQAEGHIVVIFPKKVSQESRDGRNCHTWYTPTHQRHNILSYPAAPNFLNGYQLGELLFSGKYTIDSNPELFYKKWKELHQELQSSTTAKSFQKSAKAGFNLLNLFNFEALLSGDYEEKAISTATISGGQSMGVMGSFGTIDHLGAAYHVFPHVYWAEQGYLMFDYTTEPVGAFWTQYNKPDPAFILPWIDTDDCGSDQRRLSPDITIKPATALPGEIVTISATLRNFSNIPITNVEVQFYQGEPTNGIKIGNPIIVPTLSRDTGPQTVNATWNALGNGKQKIYAVIDPDKKIEEIYDETGALNNNQAFGIIEVSSGSSAYVDPGEQAQHDYYELSLNRESSPATVVANAYIPLISLVNEVTPFKLIMAQDAPPPPHGKGFVGVPVQLQVFAGDRPLLDFNFKATSPQAPNGILKLTYADADLSAIDGAKAELALYRWNGTAWTLLDCGPISHHQEINQFIAPICGTGTFAVMGADSQSPSEDFKIHLPFITK